jgi:predicted permease
MTPEMTIMIRAIIGVFVASAFVVLIFWWMYRSFEKDEKKRRQRRLVIAGIFYAAIAAYNIGSVIVGSEPVKSLVGLPIGLLFIWAYFRAAQNVKVPPQQPD